jgi:hypothetical protein
MAFAATTSSHRKFVIRNIPISDCSGQVASVKQSGVCDGRGEAYYLVQGHECLYNLQHKDYNSLSSVLMLRLHLGSYFQ